MLFRFAATGCTVYERSDERLSRMSDVIVKGRSRERDAQLNPSAAAASLGIARHEEER
jgi:hypothetical protein